MMFIEEERNERLWDARHQWGRVFEALRSAYERTNSAWYAVEDRQALKQEEIQRLDALIQNAQKLKKAWEGRTDS